MACYLSASSSLHSSASFILHLLFGSPVQWFPGLAICFLFVGWQQQEHGHDAVLSHHTETEWARSDNCSEWPATSRSVAIRVMERQGACGQTRQLSSNLKKSQTQGPTTAWWVLCQAGHCLIIVLWECDLQGMNNNNMSELGRCRGTTGCDGQILSGGLLKWSQVLLSSMANLPWNWRQPFPRDYQLPDGPLLSKLSAAPSAYELPNDSLLGTCDRLLLNINNNSFNTKLLS